MGRTIAESNIVSLTSVVIRPIATLSVMFLAYGFYILLFILCVSIMLSTRKNSTTSGISRLYLVSTILLFLVGTINVIFYTHAMTRQTVIYFTALKTDDDTELSNYLRGDTISTADDAIYSLLAVIANIIADVMLVHRCYIIWDGKKRIGIPLVLLASVTNLLGLIVTILEIVGGSNTRKPELWNLWLRATDIQLGYNGAYAAVNFIVTILTASRVWWITRDARRLLGGGIRRLYRRIVAIVLESGLLYPIFTIVHISLTQNADKIGVPIALFPTVTLIAGIAPALIIVRTGANGLKRDVSKAGGALSTLRFDHTEMTTTVDEGARDEEMGALEHGTAPSTLVNQTRDGSIKSEDEKAEGFETSGSKCEG
ncbi:hypothetical protein V5O48_003637 [Marasmius crinis-equi]|uniref:Uncharacterized protein n=1 Tax=Marasmius crinis-equi TaxID=585013 RepID=A0ABR3FSE1_9AGAR